MTAPMNLAAEFVNAATDDDREAVIERESVGRIRKGLRQLALKLEKIAESSASEDAAWYERAAEQAWTARGDLDDLVSPADDPVTFMPDPEFTAALNGGETLWPLLKDRDAV